MKQPANYERNVFINCPFDSKYEDIFNAILFVVHKCGFILRCAKEYEDSTGIRIQNIVPVSYTHLDVYKRQVKNYP